MNARQSVSQQDDSNNDLLSNAVKALGGLKTIEDLKTLHVVTLSPKENMPPIKMFFDNGTFLPSKVETIEDDPIHGDVLIEVFFDDWRDVEMVEGDH
jgi:outer membrane lipoprotein-sorting protein